jgi:hypothetical protein
MPFFCLHFLCIFLHLTFLLSFLLTSSYISVFLTLFFFSHFFPWLFSFGNLTFPGFASHAAGAPLPNIRAGFYNGVDLATFQPPPTHPSWTDAMLAYDVSNLADFISHANTFGDINPLLDNRRTNAANAPDYIFSTFHTDQVKASDTNSSRR